jgi:hypothetical protein
VLEEDERNDDDFVSISTDEWEIGEDYWDSADEYDDPNYDPHEHIKRRFIVKNRSKKHHPVRDFSDISEINEINAPSQSQFKNLHNGDFKNFKYTVHIEEDMVLKCTYIKSYLTSIPCSHILEVIRVRKFELNRFICPFYSAQTLLTT